MAIINRKRKATVQLVKPVAKKPLTVRQTKAVKSIAKKAALGVSETKKNNYYTEDPDNVNNGLSTFFPLYRIPQNVNDDGLIGDEIILRGLKVRFWMTISGSAIKSAVLRFFVIWTKTDSALLDLTINDVFLNELGGGNTSLPAISGIFDTDKVDVVFDKSWALNLTASGTETQGRIFEKYFPFNKKVKFRSDAGGYSKNMNLVYGFTAYSPQDMGGNSVAINHTSVVYYKDP